MTLDPPPHTLSVIHKGLPESRQEMPFLPLDGELLHREGLSKQRRALSKQMPVAAVQVALRHPTQRCGAPVSKHGETLC